MTETTNAIEQKRKEEMLARDRANKKVPNSTLEKKYKIQTRAIIYDLSGSGSTTNKGPNR